MPRVEVRNPLPLPQRVRRRRASVRLIAGLAPLAFAALAFAAPPPPPPEATTQASPQVPAEASPETPPLPPDAVQQAVTTLESPDASRDARKQAAAVLLRSGQDALPQLLGLLDGKGPDATRIALADAIAQWPGAGANSDELPGAGAGAGAELAPQIGWQLVGHLDQHDTAVVYAYARALGRFNDGRMIADLRNLANDNMRPLRQREAAVIALGYQRSKQAAQILMELIDPVMPMPLRERAFGALATLTGRDDLDMNRKAWLAWWQSVANMSHDQFRAELVNNFVRRNELTQKQLDYAVSRLTQALQSVYRSTPADQRIEMIGRLLGDSLEAVRLLAVNLAVERLLDNQPIPEPLLASLRDALADPSPAVRAKTASLLRDLNDAEAANRIALQLADREVDHIETLRAYLRVIARMPRHKAVTPAMELLRQPEMRPDAAAALAASIDKGLLTDKEKQQAAFRVRQLSIPRPSHPELVALLARVGNEDDWSHIEEWLDADDAALREATARAWAASPRPLETLARHADDPVVLPIFLDAARQRGRSVAIFDALLATRPAVGDPNREAWRRAIVAVAVHVPTSHVVDAVQKLRQDEQPLALIEQLISARLTASPPEAPPPEDGAPDTPAPNAPEDAPEDAPVAQLEKVDLLLLRAKVRLAAGDPTQAMADLDEAVRSMPRPGVNVLENEKNQRWQAIDQTRIEAYLLQGAVAEAVKVAKKPLASSPEGQAAKIAPQTVLLFVAAARQRLSPQQAEQARAMLEAARQLAGDNPPPQVADALRQLADDLAAQTPATPTPTPPAPAHGGG